MRKPFGIFTILQIVVILVMIMFIVWDRYTRSPREAPETLCEQALIKYDEASKKCTDLRLYLFEHPNRTLFATHAEDCSRTMKEAMNLLTKCRNHSK